MTGRTPAPHRPFVGLELVTPLTAARGEQQPEFDDGDEKADETPTDQQMVMIQQFMKLQNVQRRNNENLFLHK